MKATVEETVEKKKSLNAQSIVENQRLSICSSSMI